MKNSNLIVTIAAIIILAVGGCLFISSAVSFVTYDTVQGNVTEVSRVRYTSKRNKRKIRYRVITSYKVGVRNYTDNTRLGLSHPRKGDKVKVYYKKSDPANAHIQPEMQQNIVSSALMAVFGVILLINPKKFTSRRN